MSLYVVLCGITQLVAKVTHMWKVLVLGYSRSGVVRKGRQYFLSLGQVILVCV